MDATRLLADLHEAHRDVAEYFGALPLEEAYRRAGDAWAPIDDLRHLTLSTSALCRGFGLPGEVMDQKFGRPSGPARDRDEIHRIYREALDAGGRSLAAFVPDSIPAEERTEETRKHVLGAWSDAASDLERVAASWPEADRDRHQLPHPLIGMLTLTEWVHFNVLHARHHIAVAERRLGRG